MDLIESLRAREELAQDDRRPAFGENLARNGNRTELAESGLQAGSLLAVRATGKFIPELVDCNSRSGSERSVRAPRSAPSARRRSEARVGPLASFGNAAIGGERKSDTADL